MKLIIGISIVISSVIGGFVLAKGQVLALWQPYELLIIGGAALGAFIIANPGNVIIQVMKGIPSLFTGSKYTKSKYMDLLSLLYELFGKARKQGLMAIEDDIETPESSDIFQRYPSILNDSHALDFIVDSMRVVVGGGIDTFAMDNLMTLEIETHEEEAHAPANAVHTVADALPGFGIVAAVLGIVITMSHLGGPPEEIGHHVAAALVGTFLGILLAYGFVGPVSTALEKRATEEGKFLECIKACILANQQGYSPQISVEFGRKTMFTDLRPSFEELEQHVRGA